MISTEELYSQFQLIEKDYGKKFQKMRTIEKLQRDGKQFISFDIGQLNLNQEREKKIRRCKYLAIQQPLYYFLNKKQKILVFNDILDYSLSQQKFKEFTESEQHKILVQIILVFNEFEQRKLDWQINDLSQFYCIDCVLQMLIIDYVQNQNKQDRVSLFKKFIESNFKEYIPDMDRFLNSKEDDQFQDLLEYLFSLENISSGQLGIEASFEQVIKWLLCIPNFTSTIYYTPFCVIKSFDTPQQIKTIIPNVPQQIVFKQKRIHKSHKYYDELMLNMEREIEISEKNMEYKQLTLCFFYIRIQSKPFLFMKYFKYTLSDVLKLWNKKIPEFYKLKVYHLCDSFSTAIFELKKASIIHRDLKPQNIFLDDWDENNFEEFYKYSLIIGDFDRSKELSQGKPRRLNQKEDDSNRYKGQLQEKNIILNPKENDSNRYKRQAEQNQVTRINFNSQILKEQVEQYPMTLMYSDSTIYKEQVELDEQRNMTEINSDSQLYSRQQDQHPMTILNSENTGQYDPPETESTFYYDIWQFGLICFTIANKGIFAGCQQGGRALEDSEYNQYFSLQAIKNTLSHTNYPESFLNLLANCLKKDYKERPPHDVIHQELWKLCAIELEIYRQEQIKEKRYQSKLF